MWKYHIVSSKNEYTSSKKKKKDLISPCELNF
jgi:hypothetical protein